MTHATLERLEAREVPATLADILPHYDPVTFVRPMPDVPAEEVLVVSVDADGRGVPGGIFDVFAAHGGGNAARVVVKDEFGRIVADVLVFEETFRGGVSRMTSIGPEIFIAPGKGGGARCVAIDLTTLASRSFAVAGFPEDWRGGIDDVSAADVDHKNGAHSPDPEDELLFLGGPVAVFAEPDGTPRLNPVYVTPDPAGGVTWEFVPAGVGFQIPGTREIGFSVQPAGATTDADGVVLPTHSLTWGGAFGDADHEFDDFAPIEV